MIRIVKRGNGELSASRTAKDGRMRFSLWCRFCGLNWRPIENPALSGDNTGFSQRKRRNEEGKATVCSRGNCCLLCYNNRCLQPNPSACGNEFNKFVKYLINSSSKGSTGGNQSRPHNVQHVNPSVGCSVAIAQLEWVNHDHFQPRRI